MSVKITITKPVYMRELIAEYVAAGFRQFSSRENEFITVEDSNDTAAVTAVYNAHDPAKYDAITAQAATARNAILTTAQTAVGVTLANLTQAQIKALLACMLYAAGGVDAATLTVKPLNEWVK